ncbi:MAG: glycine cleavage system aminomethyltransferase GcvT [Rubellimicrobium sp.]|nr:glycine cleavage system aminomethyltransferase GcvT [Rubellimicrobium sp.]
MGDDANDNLLLLGLNDLHVELGARMVPFAGYSMPVQYPAGVMKEHLHTRAAAGLFDVSHMGQVILRPKTGMAELALALEALMPVDVAGLAPGRQRYGIFTDDAGGILDDLMFANRGDHFLLVVNAGRKHEDVAHLRAHLAGVADLDFVGDRALLALQGPAAEAVLAAHVADAPALKFMDSVVRETAFGALWISRSGYTGEDGFEISVPEAGAHAFARALLADPRVAPIGLGARDSLRLEAGLCLYGHDIDTTTSPVEAGLTWAIPKLRRTGGARAGGFPGATRILRELAEGPARVRVGLRPEGRAPMREGTVLFHGAAAVGAITSGGFGPSIEAPMAMGYVPPALATAGTALEGEVRGRRMPVTVAPLPFHSTSYKR